MMSFAEAVLVLMMLAEDTDADRICRSIIFLSPIEKCSSDCFSCSDGAIQAVCVTRCCDERHVLQNLLWYCQNIRELDHIEPRWLRGFKPLVDKYPSLSGLHTQKLCFF